MGGRILDFFILIGVVLLHLAGVASLIVIVGLPIWFLATSSSFIYKAVRWVGDNYEKLMFTVGGIGILVYAFREIRFSSVYREEIHRLKEDNNLLEERCRVQGITINGLGKELTRLGKGEIETSEVDQPKVRLIRSE